jgi:predicted enzyme related to lactoylglutathione lyase
MLERDGYPAGVPCWADVIQPDLDATMAFYGDLFGWAFELRTPEGAPTGYAYARLDGLLVGGVGGPPAQAETPDGWTTYVWVDSADDTVAAVTANGGRVVAPPVDIPRAGRVAMCADPSGATFGLWQPAENRGAQLVNAHGAWNFSDLRTPDPGRAEAFYGAVFGWVADPIEFQPGQKSWMLRRPGYGDFLAERDPEIRERHDADQAPEGFTDAIAWMDQAGADESARWGITFAVADADAGFARAIQLGATEVTPLFDTEYTRMGAVEDPQGAVLTLSEYRPPDRG